MIGGGTFDGCSSLSRISIPEGVEVIASGTFLDCTSLTHVDLPSTLKNIDSKAFAGCSSLSSLDIPYGVTYVASDAIKECSNLSSITLPDTLREAVDDRGLANDGSVALFEGTALTTVKVLSGSEEGFVNLMKIIQPQLDEWCPGAVVIKEVRDEIETVVLKIHMTSFHR